MELERDEPFFLSLIAATSRELATKLDPTEAAEALVSCTILDRSSAHKLSI